MINIKREVEDKKIINFLVLKQSIFSKFTGENRKKNSKYTFRIFSREIEDLVLN